MPIQTSPSVTEHPQVVAARQFSADLVDRRWKGGVRVVIQGSMQGILRKGEATLKAGWRADVFVEPKQRKPSFVFVAESPQKLLSDLAALISGKVKP